MSNWLSADGDAGLQHLPGKAVVLSSPISTKAGLILLGLFGTGLWLLLKGLFNALVSLVNAIRYGWASHQNNRRSLPDDLTGAAAIGS
jgi:hypothetical protein